MRQNMEKELRRIFFIVYILFWLLFLDCYYKYYCKYYYYCYLLLCYLIHRMEDYINTQAIDSLPSRLNLDQIIN